MPVRFAFQYHAIEGVSLLGATNESYFEIRVSIDAASHILGELASLPAQHANEFKLAHAASTSYKANGSAFFPRRGIGHHAMVYCVPGHIVAQKGIGLPRTTQQDPVPSATRRPVLSPHHVRSRSVDNHTRDSCLSCRKGEHGNEGPHAIRTTA